MFTQEELNEIVAAHKAVYEAIQNNFRHSGSNEERDMRAAGSAAVRVVAAKIIADGTRHAHPEGTFNDRTTAAKD